MNKIEKKSQKRKVENLQEVDILTKTNQLTNISTFQCTSGSFLWGQIQCIILGSKSKDYDSPNHISEPDSNGTIINTSFKYKVKAKKGDWLVQNAIMDGYQVGYVFHHKEYSGKDLLQRAAKIGINNHEDKEVIYVNRYDFSWESGNVEMIEEEFKKYQKDEENERVKKKIDVNSSLYYDDLSKLQGGNLIIIDETKYKTFIEYFSKKQVKDNVIFVENNNNYGVQVSCEKTEYELAWMIFNEINELIGFVYDNTYSGLESEKGGDFDVKIYS